MIIGDNNPLKRENKVVHKNNKIKTTNIKPIHYKDIYNRKESINNSLEILKQRYQNGLITIDEFRKACEKLNKK